MINTQEFGINLHNARVQAGFLSCDSFSCAIEKKANFKIHRSVLYKFERGESLPSLKQFAAILCTLKPESQALILSIFKLEGFSESVS